MPNHFEYVDLSRDSFNISWTQKMGGSVNWELRNTAGQVVKAWTDDMVPAGENSKKLDMNDLSSGLYVLTLTTNSERQTLRLVLDK